MSNKVIKQHKVVREVWISRLNELKIYAENALRDEKYYTQFKVRFGDLDKIVAEFQSNHLTLYTVLSGIDGQDLTQEEVIRKEFDDLVYRIREIYVSLFNTPSSFQNKEPSVKLPKIDLPKFNGNVKDWPAFFDLYNALIHLNSNLSKAEKFQYFLSSLTKNALSCVKGITLSEDNYDIAYRTLVDRYQNKRLLATAYWSEIMDISKMNSDSAYELRTLLDCFTENLEGLKKLGLPVDSWSFVLFHMLMKKLNSEIVKRFELHYASTEIPTYDSLINFLKNQCTALESVNLCSRRTSSNFQIKDRNVNSLAPRSTKNSFFMNSSNSCIVCNGAHLISDCKVFLKKTPSDRYTLAKKKSLCLICLQPSHFSNKCLSGDFCSKCGGKHHELLHFVKNFGNRDLNNSSSSNREISSTFDSPQNNLSNNSDVVTSSPSTSRIHSGVSTPKPLDKNFRKSVSTVLLATALVDVIDSKGVVQKFRAMLDSGSQASFISRRCSDILALPSSQLSLEIKGLGKMSSQAHTGVLIEVRPAGKGGPVIVVDAVVINRICEAMPSVVVPYHNWTHISNIELADPEFYVPQEVDILLGSDILSSILLNGQLHGGVDEPIALNTIFGWVLMGKVGCNPIRSVSSFCNLVELSELNKSIKSFWELEEVPSVHPWTEDEKLCEEIFLKNVERDSSGRYIVALPFKNGFPSLLETRSFAMRRFLSLEKRLKSNLELNESYSNFMKDYFDSKHMELAPIPPPDPNKCYYIPHFCVFKPDSVSTKVRVVFDAAFAPPGGESLNQTLLVGPKLQTDLSQILLLFRCHRYVFSADIKQMYRQILVHPDYRNYQRILWRFNQHGPVQEFRLNTVTYGLNSSPYLALRVLLQLAKDEKEEFPRASKLLESDLYIDDLATGSEFLEEAKSLRIEVTELLKRGGFELRKWASNHPSLLSNIPAEFCHQSSLSFDKEDSSTIKILGLKWYPGSDSFSYEVKLENRPCTKRNILSDLARIFDPLGFLTPVSFFAKYSMQYLWSLGIEWDQEPPNDVKSKWLDYRADLGALSSLKIPRYYALFNKSLLQLHGFCDSSERGYAAVVYLRSAHKEAIDVSIVAGKSKVAPLKKLSIARLELCAAVLLSKLLKFVQDTLARHVRFDEIFAWTDSFIALYWIHSSPHRWQTFVANRVSSIQEKVDSSNWRHVPSRENPADCASRGIFPSELVGHSLWWSGPTWLKEAQETWPQVSPFVECPDQNSISKEVKKIVFAVYTFQPIFEEIITKYSNYEKILRIVSYLSRFIFYLKNPPNKKCHYITLWEIEKAELVLVKSVQKIVFREEIDLLVKKKPLPKTIRKLNPFLDSDDVLRVGGRLAKANLSFGRKHPILLPQNNRLTHLIIEYYHRIYLHPGVQTLRCLLAQKFWILNVKRIIRSVISKCNTCFKVRPSNLTPLMANLPSLRVNQVKAFSCVGVDFGGPFSVTMAKNRGSKSTKAYVCLFTCFATRAIHLELVSELSTEAFLAALRRFIARRGRCSVIHSDCGTNFVGASRYIRNIFEKAAVEEKIEFKFNCPSASHFGGVWEIGIKATKTHLARVIGEQILTFEELYTVLVQIEALLNSRPLCELSSDPNDLIALTPGHFLTLEPLVCIPDPDYSEININRLSRWQLLQRIHRDFWKRWHFEYLNTLQQRQKWTEQQPQLTIGKLVIIKDDTQPPLRWRLGRVQAVHPGSDGICRVATIKTATGTFQRPFVKLCPLPSQ